MVFITSCEDLFKKENDSTLGGNTNIPLNQVGNTFTSTVNVDGSYSNITATATITENEDGVATVHVTANLKDDPRFAFVNNLIPSQYKDSQGNINLEGKVKATDEGMLDYTNLDDRPFVMVRYDCKAGDTYTLGKSDGNTITRKVISKSSTDDYSYGMMLIKTILIEQDSRIPGIEKIIYRFNHKFGIVYAGVVAEDGSTAGITIYPQNYLK